MGIRQSAISVASAAAFLLMSLILGSSVFFANAAIQQERTAVARQAEFKQLGITLANASDYLTNECRRYVQFGDRQFLDAYWTEILVTKTRDKVLSQLQKLGAPQAAFDQVALAKHNSDALVQTETRAMRLVLEATEVRESAMPAAEAAYHLSAHDEALSPAAKFNVARTIMFDATYDHDKSIIMGPIARFQSIINAQATHTVAVARGNTQVALTVLIVLAVLIPMGMGVVLWVFRSLLGVPVVAYAEALRKRKANDSGFVLAPAGTYELHALASAFNDLFQDNHRQLSANQGLVRNLSQVVEQVTQNAESLRAASAHLAHVADQTGQATTQIAASIQHVAAGTTQQAESATQTATTVGQMARAIDEVAAGAQEQARAITSSSSLTTQISAAIRQVASSAQAGAEGSARAAEAARIGVATVESSIEGITRIKTKVALSAERVQEMGDRSAQIGAIVQTIDDIAEQTNLLALNAAIEAARAGEHGKGFAVVADEVRKLAERAGISTKEISALVSGIQTTVAEAVQAMGESAREVEAGAAHAGESGQALASILQATETVSQQVASIADAAEQMNASAAELVSAMDGVSAVVEENTAATEELAAAASEVTQATRNIAQVSHDNNAGVESVSAAVEEITGQVTEVTTSAQTLSELADALHRIIGQVGLAADDELSNAPIVPRRRDTDWHASEPSAERPRLAS